MPISGDFARTLASVRISSQGAFEQQKTELAQIAWVLSALESEFGVIELTAGEIETAILDGLGHHIPRQRIFSLLSANPAVAHRRKIGGLHRFRPLAAAKRIVAVPPATSSSIVITPDNALDGRRKLQETFASLKGIVRICDPYSDSATFDFLTKVSASASIRLLTAKVQQEAEFRRDFQAYKSQHGNLEIRVDDTRTLHDRYAVDEDRAIAIGTSLNGIGKRQSMIVELTLGVREALLAGFEKLWTAARPFL